MQGNASVTSLELYLDIQSLTTSHVVHTTVIMQNLSPVIEIESTHLYRYLSELDPRGPRSAKGGYLKGHILFPPHILKDNPTFRLSTCLSGISQLTNQAEDGPHSSLIHIIHKGKHNRRDRGKEPVPHSGHWKQEFQIIEGDVYVKNNTSPADESRDPIPAMVKVCSLAGNTISLDGRQASLHLALILLKTEHKARGEDLHLDQFLLHQVHSEEVRRILQNPRERNIARIKLEVFDAKNTIIGVAYSGPIINSSSSLCGSLDIRDVTPLKSCARGGRKIIIISEFTLAKDVRPRFQLYSPLGIRLIKTEETMLEQPIEEEISVGRNTITFLTPMQNKADEIMLNRFTVRLVLERQSDGVTSQNNPKFSITPHDFYQGVCLLCDYDIDGTVRDIPKVIHAQPGVKRRI